MTHPRNHCSDKDPSDGEHAHRRLIYPARLENRLAPCASLRRPLCDLRLALQNFRADEPARALDVRERDDPEHDGQRDGRVAMRERGEREERFRVEYRWCAGRVREHHARADKQWNLREDGQGYCGDRRTVVLCQQVLPPRRCLCDSTGSVS